MVVSVTMGGWEVKYPSIRPIISDSSVAPNTVRITNCRPSTRYQHTSIRMLTAYIVTATGIIFPLAKKTSVLKPAMPPTTMSWGRIKAVKPTAYRAMPITIIR
jgi:hypothetical protein